MAIEEKVSKVPLLGDLVTSETTLGEFEEIVSKFITVENKTALKRYPGEKVVVVVLRVAGFRDTMFSAQEFDSACVHPLDNNVHLPFDEVVEILTICRRMGLCESADVRGKFVNRDVKLKGNLQRLSDEYRRLPV